LIGAKTGMRWGLIDGSVSSLICVQLRLEVEFRIGRSNCPEADAQ
jgi:hypothetical protein